MRASLVARGNAHLTIIMREITHNSLTIKLIRAEDILLFSNHQEVQEEKAGST